MRHIEGVSPVVPAATAEIPIEVPVSRESRTENCMEADADAVHPGHRDIPQANERQSPAEDTRPLGASPNIRSTSVAGHCSRR
jgi:hypothetical protein